jgi:protein-glutamine gamma-glutamyltransferase
MPDCLHPLLLLLTLLDLGFVQATDIVSGSGLLPLWLLAAASPWLRSLQRFISYRIAWNVGVLLVFTLLVRHASTTGLLHMLEDGLLLAVLCQVHLLNNVGERQRPDLVFFNSFLIAFVTSFFAPDLSWSVLFVTHAMVLVPALQVNVLARRGCAVARPALRATLRDSLPRTAAIGAVTALVFTLLPRDFHRSGWLGDALALGTRLEAGLGEEIRIDNERPTRLGTEIVLRIEPESGEPDAVPGHWRGTAFSIFEGSAWQPQDARQLGSRFTTDPTWETRPDGSWRRAMRPQPGSLRVRLYDTACKRVPTPLNACELQLNDAGGLLLDPKSYGVFSFLRVDDAPHNSLDYTVRLSALPGRMNVMPRTRAHFLELTALAVPQVARNLAGQLRELLPNESDPATIAENSAAWLQEHRRYQLPGEPGFARNFDEFLLGTGAGHCEYFATALALVLRLQGVPCRLVGGYLAHEWDPATRSVIARARDAHAWVEALLPDGSWLTLDATPASEVMAAHPGAASWWGHTREQLEGMWNAVVSFDGKRRAELVEQVLTLPGRTWSVLRNHPIISTATILILGALIRLRRRKRQSLPAIVNLLHAARTCGLGLRAGETPRELLVRAAASKDPEIPPAQLATLEKAAQQHEAMRYASATPTRAR